MNSRPLRLLSMILIFTVLLCDIPCFAQAAAQFTPIPAPAGSSASQSYATEIPTPSPEATLSPVVSNPDILLSAEIGYGGVLSYLVPMPLTVTIQNDGPDVQGAVAIDIFRNTLEYDRYEYPITLSQNSKKQFVIPLTLRMKQDIFTVELVVDGIVAASTHVKPGRVFQGEALLGVLSEDPASVSYMNIIPESDTEIIGETWQCMTLSDATFPETDELMNAFTILVIDGFDARALSEKQRDILARWIDQGGIVLLGGGAQAATTYPYFEKYTGIAAGSLIETNDLSAPLSAYVKRVMDEITAPVMLTRPHTQFEPIVAGEYPLVYKTEAGRGLIFTATFSLGARAIAQWSGARNYWRNFLTTAALRSYSERLQSKRFDQYDNSYMDMSILNRVPVKNDSSTLPFMLVFAVYLLLTGFGSYFLLKKIDKRTFLWLTIPIMAIAGALIIRAMGVRLHFDAPLSASLAAISIDEEGGVDARAYVGVTSASRDELKITPPKGATIQFREDYYDSYYVSSWGSSETPAPVQKKLKYRFYVDGTGAVGTPPDSAWTVHTMQVNGLLPEIQLKGSVWFEEDGLYAEVTNLSDQPLYDCTLITGMGYANVGELLPGDTAKAYLQEATADELKVARERGHMIEGKIMSGMYGYREDIYSAAYSSVYPEIAVMTSDEAVTAFYNSLSSQESSRRSFRQDALQTLANKWNNMETDSNFHFVGFNNEIGKPEMILDGQKIERSGHAAYVDVALTYNPVGPTGIVNYAPGTLPCYRANGKDEQTPTITQERFTLMNYFELNSQPAFAYTIPDAHRINIESLSIMAESYETTPIVQLYNNESGLWDQQKLSTVKLTGEQVKPYIDEKNEVFVRYTQGDQSIRYAGINTPRMEVKGRVK